MIAGTFRFKEKGGDWQYPEGVGAIGVDENDYVYTCLDESITPKDDGISGLECTNSGEKDYEGFTIKDNTYTQDKPEDDEGFPTLEDWIKELEDQYDVTIDDYQDIYYICSIDTVDAGETTEAECDEKPGLDKKNNQSKDAKKYCFATVHQIWTACMLILTVF